SSNRAALLLQETGSDEFLAGIRERAKERGVELGANSEEELFAAVELPWIPPELREESEFALSAYPQLQAQPGWRLLEASDVRGVIHNHSNWSDGAVPIMEMVAASQERNYDYFGLADHSQSSTVAGG